MADANTYLKVTELDFDGIKSNLKSYLSARPEFKDYNFEGSAIGTLIDVLAYNTHYNAYYINMLANEMFLDTAQQRDSVVSRARELGYLPTASRGARATLNLIFSGVPEDKTRMTLKKNTSFISTLDGVTYNFVLPDDQIIDRLNNRFEVSVVVKEGTPLTHRTTYSKANDTKIIIPNRNADTDSIRVRVQSSSTDSTITEFYRATNISTIRSTDPVYFVEEAPDGKYQIIFGSGALGRSLVDGNVVIVDYLVNNNEAANGAKFFSAKTILTDVTYENLSVATVNVAAGGRAQESVDSIKFNAPRLYQTQNRAVVAEDFERIILNEQSDVESIVAFGGEQADPPVPGKVYIAVKPVGEQFMTISRKAQIKESIASRCMLSIDPVIIDPEYTYLVLDVSTNYAEFETTLKSGDIKSLVIEKIREYSTNNLERFGNKLRFSRLLRLLDNIDGSVINNEAILSIQKRFTPSTQRVQKITLKFNNRIRPSTVSSTEFTYGGNSCYVDDDGLGNLRIYRYSDSKRVDVVSNAGVIDYTTGKFELENFLPEAYSGIEIKVTVKPESLDITPVREQILIMNPNDSNITVIGEK